MNIKELEAKAAWVRRELWTMTMRLKRGHLASCYSMVDILVALYYGGVLKHFKTAPEHPERDRLIISKGHAAAALYPILADLGYFPMEELQRYGQPGALLGMFADPKIPGIECVSDSLGHGLGIGAGMAMAAKLNGQNHRIFVILGDAELNEGSCWEAAMFASHYKLDNLISIVDNNGLGILGNSIGNEPHLEGRWYRFGWSVFRMNGHDFCAGDPPGIMDTMFAVERKPKERPKVIIADTTKGKGVSFMEGRAEWHNKMPTPEQELIAQIDLGIGV